MSAVRRLAVCDAARAHALDQTKARVPLTASCEPSKRPGNSARSRVPPARHGNRSYPDLKRREFDPAWAPQESSARRQRRCWTAL